MPYTDDQRSDHARDLRKHDPRPGERDYTPLRLQPSPIDGAMQVAIEVKNTKNIFAAAALIEAYCAAQRAADRLDAVAAGARP